MHTRVFMPLAAEARSLSQKIYLTTILNEYLRSLLYHRIPVEAYIGGTSEQVFKSIQSCIHDTILTHNFISFYT